MIQSKIYFKIFFVFLFVSCIQNKDSDQSNRKLPKISINKKNKEIKKTENKNIINLAYSSEHRFFISSKVYNGNLGGAEGADSKCRELALASGDNRNYKAIISTSFEIAKNRLSDTGPVVVYTDKTTFHYIADNVAELFEIDINGEWTKFDESFNSIGKKSSMRIWSATSSGNFYLDEEENSIDSACNNWTSSEKNISGSITSAGFDITGGCYDENSDIMEGSSGVGTDICYNFMNGFDYQEGQEYNKKVFTTIGELEPLSCHNAAHILCLSQP
jgi:hypothetical protein